LKSEISNLYPLPPRLSTPNPLPYKILPITVVAIVNFIFAIASNNSYHSIMVAFNEIEEVAKRIGEQTKAEAVVLFGSHARGQAGADSDVDLLVIAESDLPRHKRSRQLHLMFKPYPFAMDILVYTPEEVETERDFELSFISRVLREGKRLYGQAV
jgi:predicted nucleotidyltransferase